MLIDSSKENKREIPALLYSGNFTKKYLSYIVATYKKLINSNDMDDGITG